MYIRFYLIFHRRMYVRFYLIFHRRMYVRFYLIFHRRMYIRLHAILHSQLLRCAEYLTVLFDLTDLHPLNIFRLDLFTQS